MNAIKSRQLEGKMLLYFSLVVQLDDGYDSHKAGLLRQNVVIIIHRFNLNKTNTTTTKEL